MKKRPAFLLLLLGLAPVFAFAQTETVAPKPKKLQQLYFSYSPGIAFTSSENTLTRGQHRKLQVTATNPKDYLFRFGCSYTGFGDDQPESRQWIADYPDRSAVRRHYVISPFLAFGKRKQFSERMQAQVLAGLSYNNYRRPENIHRYTEDIGIYGTQEHLINEMKNYHSAGILVQAEAMVAPLRFAGLTFGVYYHFIPKISYAGINLSLNLGKLRPKTNQIL